MPFNPNFKLGRKRNANDDLSPDADDYVEEKPKASRKKNTKSEEEKKDSVKVNYKSNSLVCEITILITGAICVILFLSNFNLTGKVGVFLNQIMLGLFGFAGWMVPVFLFAGVWYILYHKTNTFVKLRVAGVIVDFIMFCGICQLISTPIYNPQTSILDYYNKSIDGSGGGLIGGILYMGLYPTFGKAGAYIILIVTIIIGFILITGKSFLNALKNDVISLGLLIKEYFDTKDEEEQQMQEKLQEKRIQRIEQRNNRMSQGTAKEEMDEKPRHDRASSTRRNQSDSDNIEEMNYQEEQTEHKTEPNINIYSGASYDEIQDDSFVYGDESSNFTNHNLDFSDLHTGENDSEDVISNEDDSDKELEKDIMEPVHRGLNETFKKFFSRKLLQPNFKKHHDDIVEEPKVEEDDTDAIDVENVDEIKKVSNYRQLQISSIDSSVSDDFSNDMAEDEEDELLNNYQSLSDADNFVDSVDLADEEYSVEDIENDYDDSIEDDTEDEPEDDIDDSDENQSDDSDGLELADETANKSSEDLNIKDSTVIDDDNGGGDVKEEKINLFGTTPLDSVIKKDDNDMASVLNHKINSVTDLNKIDEISGDYRTVVTSKGKVINVELDSMPGAKRVRPVPKSMEEPLEKVDISVKSDKEAAKAYVFPTTNLLTRGRTGKSQGKLNYELKETAKKLEDTLRNFGVGVTVNNISCGPAVTRYELQPEQGVKVSKIISLTDDIKLNLAAADIRIEAPIPGKAAIGIEVPNKENRTVLLRDILESEEFKNHPSKLAFAVGKDIAGQTIVADIAAMPHLLIAGATGSGKSVCINTLIMSILYKSNPVDVRLMMIDPKVVELSVYNGVPHLLIPVVTDPKKAASALNWAVTEMTERYKKFADLNVRDVASYNARIQAANAKHPDEENTPTMPQIVIIVDELADLMMVAPSEVEDAICRLAQMARAAGIHLVIATQRPSVNVITGVIKANIPSRIAFAVSSGVDSRTIIDMNGAEKLLGRGDMLFYPYGYQKPVRVQGAFISDKEVANVVQFLSKQKKVKGGLVDLSEKVTSSIESKSETMAPSDRDPYFEQAARLLVEKDKASIGMLQRVFRIGFNRAARIMDQLAECGVVGDEEGTKARKVLVNMEQLENILKEQ